MKRVILILLLLLLLSAIGVVAWTAAGLPPVRMVWRYGFSYGPEPSGRALTVEGLEFVEIGPGCYLMGSVEKAEGGDWLGRWCARFGLRWGDQPKPSNEMPVHWVEFPHGFWIARYEITNAQYEAFDPEHERYSRLPEDHHPLGMGWQRAKAYCAWIGRKSGLEIRLPSESEWECACRAGSGREFCFGDDETGLTEYAWYSKNSKGWGHAVGTRRANAWGLHDLHGSVWEWCEDSWHKSYEGAPVDGVAWTERGEEWQPGYPMHVMRGGCERSWAEFNRSAHRTYRTVSNFGMVVGFRPAFGALGKSATR